MTFDKTRSAGYLANHLARLFAQHLAAGIAPLGLAPAQFMALLELWREDGLTQAELCARLDVEQATMAGTLGRMARDGLIERRAHPADRRAQTVHLTDRARALEAPATEAARAVNARALAALPEAERAPFVASLHRITEEMRRRKP
ncbi:MarR family transcriptional regulator [Frigidibacter albus]|uniref:MarR family transcriptional regulator n=1 Tax=Frigidibacter albus TaxID=1465486 RepID=A0A6L8VHR1_9RHOB|nr:MarR family transcriptional regulator [Frigidibacter albus]MZQ89753.1 MarR family transcriptional regulator [Frigidibacter albus]NBE31872.1 MarR family transcriptional regulator [Frigidibacter albus]GGH56845.1 MarR family transcriptional regulator [Frigidibacter albus]